MDLNQLKLAIDKLIADGLGDEPVCLKVLGEQLTVTDVTVVVESDDWVPGTVLLRVEEVDDS